MSNNTFYIQTNHEGIVKKLKNIKPNDAILEYVKNAIDANATSISLNFTGETLGLLDHMSISDNGDGIPYDKLQEQFGSFLISNRKKLKEDKYQHSFPFARNGQGRLTFSSFAENAIWDSIFAEGSENFQFAIIVSHSSLNKNEILNEISTTDKMPGTTVTFKKFHDLNISDLNNISDYIVSNLCWYIELRKFSPNPLKIFINNKELQYEKADEFEFKTTIQNYSFNIKFVRWNQNKGEKYSKFYFINGEGFEVYKTNTTLNNKSDDFFHSVYIKSDFFNDLNLIELKQESTSLGFFNTNQNKKVLKKLDKQIQEVLISKREPFLEDWVNNVVIPDLEKKKAFPVFGDSTFEKLKEKELRDVVRSIIIADPRVFSRQNEKQAQILIKLLEKVVDSQDGRDSLLDIIESVLNLNKEQLSKFANLLRNQSLSGVISLMDLINRRFEVIEKLKLLVFEKSLKANERDHLQKIVQECFWLFGESYNLISANQTFTQSINKYKKILKVDSKDSDFKKIDFYDIDPEFIKDDRRPDIFLASEIPYEGYKEHIIIELKHPRIHLGREEHFQVQDYLNKIKTIDNFNSPNNIWKFYLIGNSYDENIKDLIKGLKVHGQQNLSYTNLENLYIY